MIEILMQAAVVVAICSLAWMAVAQADTQWKMQKSTRNLRSRSTFTRTSDGQK